MTWKEVNTFIESQIAEATNGITDPSERAVATLKVLTQNLNTGNRQPLVDSGFDIAKGRLTGQLESEQQKVKDLRAQLKESKGAQDRTEGDWEKKYNALQSKYDTDIADRDNTISTMKQQGQDAQRSSFLKDLKAAASGRLTKDYAELQVLRFQVADRLKFNDSGELVVSRTDKPDQWVHATDRDSLVNAIIEEMVSGAQPDKVISTVDGGGGILPGGKKGFNVKQYETNMRSDYEGAL